MTSDEILKQMASLPDEGRREIENLISRLNAHYRQNKNETAGPLEAEPFLGMWSDRDEMADSSTWVRDTRNKHWAD
jgi:hypothetical protein